MIMRRINLILTSVLILLIFVTQATIGEICVFADGVYNIGGRNYKLLDAAKNDYSGGSVTGHDNGIGYYKADTIDEEHGLSAVFGADVGADTSREGAWVAISTPHKTANAIVVDLEFYSLNLKGGVIEFMLQGKKGSANQPDYFMQLNDEGIAFDTDNSPWKFNEETATPRIPFSKDEWHKLRLLLDKTNKVSVLFLDDMETPIKIQGKIAADLTSIESLRIICKAADTYAAIDNTAVYKAEEIEQGYEPPRLNLGIVQEQVTESEAAEVEARIETKTEINKVEFFVDGVSKFVDEEAPYVFSYLFEPGEYAVYAVATDKYSETGRSKELTIVSRRDTKPKIISGITDGLSYKKERLRNIPITVTVSDTELKTAYVTVDGDKFCEIDSGKNNVDLSGITLGKHKITVYAENILGQSSIQTAEIIVEKVFEKIVYSDDYEEFMGADGDKGQSNNIGFRRGEEIRTDFRKSAVIGAQGAVDTSKEGAWLGIPLENCSSYAEVSFDWYFNAIRGQAEVQIRSTDGSVKNLFKVADFKLRSADGLQAYPFEADKWYSVRLAINTVKKQYTVYLNDEAALLNVGFSSGAILDSLRLVSKLPGEPATYFAVDNTVVTHITAAPVIEKIISESAADMNEVSYKDKEITIYFTGGLEPTSVYPSKFKLSGEGNVPEVTKAEYDPQDLSVKLTLSDSLTAEKVYRLTVAENVVMSNGMTYGECIYSDFTVAESLFKAENLSISNDGSFSCTIINNADSEKEVYLFANVYDGGILTHKTVKRCRLSAGENKISEIIEGYSANAEVEVFLWDSLSMPYCLGKCEL